MYSYAIGKKIRGGEGGRMPTYTKKPKKKKSKFATPISFSITNCKKN